MNLFLDYTEKELTNARITISGSKSESNRLLILQQLFANLRLENVSDSDDSKHLSSALSSNDTLVDIGHAGTAMRFLTAYFAVREGRETILTGSGRMQNRPIKILVEALRSLGADIAYEKKDGYPPLRIKGKELSEKRVRINGNVSSQYISALLLIAPSLKEGLEIELVGEITSRPYLEMTLSMLKGLGISTTFEKNHIKIEAKKAIAAKTIVIESDWSSASYYYSLVALSKIGTTLTLSSYKKKSLQGDSCLAEIYTKFGIETTYQEHMITLTKANVILNASDVVIELDLRNAPDIAQTIAVTCFGLGIACDLTGLHTLKIKETDRLVALDNELTKLGATITVTADSLHLKASSILNKNIVIPTYNDHRMAMAFAPLSLKVPITIQDAEVVTKSYTDFWNHFHEIFSER